MGRLSPDYIVQDGVVPRSRLGEALAIIERLSRKHELRVANVFHAGDGNLHPLILYDGRVAGELERAEELAGEILAMCIELGGSITGEHGVGVEKRQLHAGDVLRHRTWRSWPSCAAASTRRNWPTAARCSRQRGAGAAQPRPPSAGATGDHLT